MELAFRVLGPLQVLRDGRDVTPAAAKQRVVLAVLVLAVGRAVPLEQLVDAVWGDSPVGRARKGLQVYVARLRELLGDDAIVTADAGYRIDPARCRVDLADFEAAVAEADTAEEAGDVEAAVRSLRAALALWRGAPLTNVPSEPLRQRASVSLAERRLQVAERCCDLEVGLGRAADVVAELRMLTEEHLLRERSWVSLMRALYASGRQADAMAAYHQVAEALADQLGVDPGAELRQTYEAILTQSLEVARTPAPPREAPAPEVPRQLPARPVGFVGRKAPMDRLATWLDDPGGTPVALVSGPPGVGKSALAVATGHLLADRFPDGQLYVDVRGFSTEQGLTAGDVLPRLVRALGVAGDQMPVEVDELAAMYRSRMAGKRVLVVVDNAASPDVVRPLLPGAPGCAVLVTSRNQLRPLVAVEGARLLPLGVLSAEEARLALAAQVDEQRLTAEPGAVDRLVGLCGRLPLALRIAGANLATHPNESVGEHAVQLDRGGRLTSLWSGGEESLVAGAFATSYTALDDTSRRVFRQLGLVPGADFTADAVAALTGEQDPYRVLDALTAASLLDRHAPGRYRMHDLVRDYAIRCAERDDDTASRSLARRRLFDWYLAMVDAALVPRLKGFHRQTRPRTDVEPTGTPDYEWMDQELPNLVATVEDAAHHGPPEYAWHLADAMRPYLDVMARHQEWSAVTKAALPVAERDGDMRARAAMYACAGGVHSVLGDVEEALRMTRRAQELYAESGDAPGEAQAWQSLAIILALNARLVEAHVAFERALEGALGSGDSHRYMMNLHNLAHLKAEMGQLTRAHADLQHALEVNERRRVRDRHLSVVHDNLALVLRRLGDPVAATAHRETAMRIDAELDIDAWVADSHHELARILCDQGEYTRAREEAAAALSQARELDVRRLIVEAQSTVAEIEVRAGRRVDRLDELEALPRDPVAKGEPRLEARLLDVIAWVHEFAGDHAAALAAGERELEIGRARSMRLVEDAALTVTTAALIGLGRLDEAVERGTEALRRHRETGYRIREARTLCHLGDAHAARGEQSAAVDCWRQAHEAYQAIGTAEIAEAERRIAAVGVRP